MYKNGGPGQQLLQSNQQKKKLVQKQHLKNRKRADWARLANSLLCVADSVASRNEVEFGKKTGCPILVIGNPTFNAVRGQRSTSTKGLIKYLARFFIVFVIDEFNTSRACNECHQHVKKEPGKGTRIWKCGNKECGKHGEKMNKDVSAWYLFIIYLTLA
jgi:transposase